jgi:hypothetical protein
MIGLHNADVRLREAYAGQLSVFGIDEVDLTLVGKSAGTTASCQLTKGAIVDVRFPTHSGLKSDIARGQSCANSRNARRGKTAS